MRYVTYKKVKSIRFIVLIVFLVIMAAAAAVLYYDFSKIAFFNNGESSYSRGELVQAESWFSMAKSHEYFEYMDPEIAQRLSELKNVTDLKQFMSGISKELNKANASKDMEGLIAEYNKYMEEYEKQSQIGAGSKSIFEELSNNSNIERVMENYFKAAISYLKTEADNNIKNKRFDDENFMNFLIKIPDKYFGGASSKKQEVDSLIKDYDDRKIDIVLQDKGIADTVDEAENMIAFSKENSQDYKGLLDKMEGIWSEVMKQDIVKDDYDTLYYHYTRYKGFTDSYLPNSPAVRMVDSTIKDDYSKFKGYVNDGKYDEAIQGFNKIAKFIDTTQDIKDARIKQIQSDPVVALNEAFPGASYKNVLSGKDTWGAKFYVLGYDENNLYLVRFDDDFQYVKTEYSIPGLQTGINSLSIMENLNYNGPVVLAEGGSTERKAEYIGLSMVNDSFSEILRLQSDGFTVESNSRLIVDNPLGEGAGRQCYYTFENGYFVFSEATKDYTDITLDNIGNYKDGKIGFSCTLFRFNSNTNSALVYDSGTYVLLNNVGQISGSRFYVIGEYAGEGTAMKDGVTITVPVINVLEIQ